MTAAEFELKNQIENLFSKWRVRSAYRPMHEITKMVMDLYAAQQSKMPTEEEIKAAASEYEHGASMGYAVKDELSGLYRNDDFIAGVEWLRNQIENQNK
jgi:hypothetical protein